MAHNSTRAERMKSRSVAQLLAIVAGKTLSSAAARAELRRRDLVAVQTRKGWHAAPAEVPTI